jgi:Zn-dependent membrane protease YugP|tara:strand:- start:1736 stop:2401 length:666 start_codon:yes stop_codon:yes gene_type:complete
MIVFMIIGGITSNRLKNKFKKYSKISTSSNLSGQQIALKMLEDHDISNVKVVSVPGKLTDHYNPIDRTINLSPDVFNGRHISAAAVAAHECGHAVQHATSYQWLQMRSQMVPMVSASSKMMNIIMLLGLFGAGVLHMFPFQTIILVFVILQAVVTSFTLITLPVEFDASKRALIWLKSANITNSAETKYAEDALNWAAKTYVVAALASAAYLLYYVSMLRD